MIKSMTGFGKASGELKGRKISVEVRSLNSKQLDLSLKIPSVYRDKEQELRSILTKELERGKADVSIYTEYVNKAASSTVNKELAMAYYKELKKLSKKMDNSNTDYLGLIMKMPDIYKAEREEFNEEDWKVIKQLLDEALQSFNKYRMDEGKILETEIKSRINNILKLLKGIEKHDPERIASIRTRINKSLKEVSENIDQNRFEQELIYYIEKIDVTEEKVRLKAHCDYFIETMDSSLAEGRKLNFISQEIGREINTIGSKANDVVIQKMVVQMKDELEKIKEQSLNVL